METFNFFGNATFAIILVLGVAWLLVPIWVWRIRDDMKKHIQQQERLLKVTESILQEARLQANKSR